MNEQPTIAELVAGLREEADGWEEASYIFNMTEEMAKPMLDSIARLRAAADRLDALAKLAGAVQDTGFEMWVKGSQADWFAARDRLTK